MGKTSLHGVSLPVVCQLFLSAPPPSPSSLDTVSPPPSVGSEPCAAGTGSHAAGTGLRL